MFKLLWGVFLSYSREISPVDFGCWAALLMPLIGLVASSYSCSSYPIILVGHQPSENYTSAGNKRILRV